MSSTESEEDDIEAAGSKLLDAAWSGNEGRVKEILEETDPGIRESGLKEALWRALWYGETEAARILLSNGASFSPRDHVSPYCKVLRGGDRPAMIELLMAK